MTRSLGPLLGLCLGSTAAFGQATPGRVQQVLDSALHYTRTTSLYSSQATWDAIARRAHELAATATTVRELKPALEYVLNALPDPHGRYLDPVNFSPVAAFTDWATFNAASADQRPRDRTALAIVNDTSRSFSYRRLPNHVGYLRILGISPGANVTREAETIRAAVVELAANGVTAWIVDLRYNAGGNMNPMMAGIAPLLGDGPVGYLSGPAGDTLGRWRIRGNNFLWDDYQAVQLHGRPQLRRAPPIAVLLSRYTLSSGEFVAVTFKGRPGTRFFGETSGGLSTSTNWERIGGDLIVSVSSGIYTDRTGTIYRHGVPVDEAADFVPDQDPATDPGVVAATRWLAGSKR